jgi:hypothetical protein
MVLSWWIVQVGIERTVPAGKNSLRIVMPDPWMSTTRGRPREFVGRMRRDSLITALRLEGVSVRNKGRGHVKALDDKKIQESEVRQVNSGTYSQRLSSIIKRRERMIS